MWALPRKVDRSCARLGTLQPAYSAPNQAPASSPDTCSQVAWSTLPVPLVVRSSVSQCSTMTVPSDVSCTSVSNAGPHCSASSKEGNVFSGASWQLPRCPMTQKWRHGCWLAAMFSVCCLLVLCKLKKLNVALSRCGLNHLENVLHLQAVCRLGVGNGFLVREGCTFCAPRVLPRPQVPRCSVWSSVGVNPMTCPCAGGSQHYRQQPSPCLQVRLADGLSTAPER